MDFTRVYLRKGTQYRVESGHPWVYKTEIDYVDNEPVPGEIVDVYNHREHFIGRGYINPRSQITVRIMTRKKEDIDTDFFCRRIQAAWQHRQSLLSEPDYCRLIYGEADLLPGLIVDKFGEYMVIQTLALGIDQYKNLIVSILNEMFSPKGIYERNDVSVRELEGLEQYKGFITGDFPTLIKVKENGITFYADIKEGQKTGFFYDQRENRASIRNLVQGAEVLDCFCHTGSFSVHAALYGAKHVTGVDISDFAIDLAKKNAELNKVTDKCEFIIANAFDLLRAQVEEEKQYDVVILDPPAFTKSRKTIEGAARGYKEINLRGLKLVRPGGFLITCSCSYHMDKELFKTIIIDAAHDAKKIIRQIDYRTQAKDHPILLSSPETEYLKFMVVQVLE